MLFSNWSLVSWVSRHFQSRFTFPLPYSPKHTFLNSFRTLQPQRSSGWADAGVHQGLGFWFLNTAQCVDTYMIILLLVSLLTLLFVSWFNVQLQSAAGSCVQTDSLKNQDCMVVAVHQLLHLRSSSYQSYCLHICKCHIRPQLFSQFPRIILYDHFSSVQYVRRGQ